MRSGGREPPMGARPRFFVPWSWGPNRLRTVDGMSGFRPGGRSPPPLPGALIESEREKSDEGGVSAHWQVRSVPHSRYRSCSGSRQPVSVLLVGRAGESWATGQSEAGFETVCRFFIIHGIFFSRDCQSRSHIQHRLARARQRATCALPEGAGRTQPRHTTSTPLSYHEAPYDRRISRCNRSDVSVSACILRTCAPDPTRARPT